MPLIFEIILSGILATLAMTPFFRIFRSAGANAPSLIDVVGTLFTREERRSRPIAIALHYAMGVTWAFIYYLLVRVFGNPQPIVIFMLCFGISAFHGLIVAFNLANMVAEHPTHREYRVQSPAVAAIYLATHVIYGAVLGVLFGLFHVVG